MTAHRFDAKTAPTVGPKGDLQFSDLGACCGFGFAAFDNAQVRHAVHFDPLYLKFAK